MRRLTKKMPKMVAIILAFALMAPIVTRPIDAEAARARWINYSGSWYYELSNGNLARGWQYIGGNWYYFHPTSQKMLTGMQRISNTYYYFEASGAMVTGWVRYSGYWYYFQPGTGAITDGWKLINGNWYYFDYAMSTGMETIGSKKYYFGYDGAMKTGWQSYGGEWYYFQPGNGAALKNQWIGNYYVDSSGAMATNQWIGNYYVGPGGEWIPGFNSNFNGWYLSGGKWYYYTNGSLTYGHKTINSIPYYFSEYTGAMCANEWGFEYDETHDRYREYYYDSNGAPVTGWRNLYGGLWYYFAPYDMDGYKKYEAIFGWLQLGENTYYIAYEGAMLTGWQYFDGYWYYFEPSSGAAVKNKWIGNYYLKADGRMATNEWIGQYYVGYDGAWIPGYSGSTDPEASAWKNAYLNYIEQNKYEYTEYALVYVDNDDIPELYLSGIDEAAGDILCSYKNGGIIEQHMNRKWGGSYIYKSGLFFNFNGNMGWYSANVYELTDNGVRNLFSGYQEDTYEELGNGDYDMISNFYIGSTQVTEEAFYEAIYAVYDLDEARDFHRERVSYSTIKQQINQM